MTDQIEEIKRDFEDYGGLHSETIRTLIAEVERLTTVAPADIEETATNIARQYLLEDFVNLLNDHADAIFEALRPYDKHIKFGRLLEDARRLVMLRGWSRTMSINDLPDELEAEQ